MISMDARNDQRRNAAPAIELRAENIPSELQQLRRWVTWRYDIRDDKPTKVPYGPRGMARSNDPATWLPFDQAVKAAKAKAHAGVGFMFTADDQITGVDLDDCRDPATGNLAAWATEIIDRFATYAEVSPSATGVKLWVRGRWTGSGHKKFVAIEGKRVGAVECYDSLRYFAATGHRLPASPTDVRSNQEAIDWLAATYFAPATKATKANGKARSGQKSLAMQPTVDPEPCVEPSPESQAFASELEATQQVSREVIGKPPVADALVLDAIRNDARHGARVSRLLAGDLAEFAGDASDADIYLAGRFAYFVGDDAPRIARMMEGTALRRDKWAESRPGGTYLSITIAKAIRNSSDFFAWPAAGIAMSKPVASAPAMQGNQPTASSASDDVTTKSRHLARAREGLGSNEFVGCNFRDGGDGDADGIYEFVWRIDGRERTIVIGDIDKLMSFTRVDNTLINAIGHSLPDSKDKNQHGRGTWRDTAKAIAAIRCRIKTVTDEERLAEWVSQFVANNQRRLFDQSPDDRVTFDRPKDSKAIVERGTGFQSHVDAAGVLLLKLDELQEEAIPRDAKMNGKRIAYLLSRIGFESRPISAHDENGRTRTGRFWVKPLNQI